MDSHFINLTTPSEMFTQFDMQINVKRAGIINKTNNLVLIENAKPTEIKVDNKTYKAQVTGDPHINTCGFSANLIVKSDKKYASWIAIAPPEWNGSIQGDLLSIDPSTVECELFVDQDIDDMGNHYQAILARVKNTNNFDVYATVNYDINQSPTSDSLFIKAGTTNIIEELRRSQSSINITSVSNSTFQAIGYNVLEKHNVTSANFGADLYVENGNLYIRIYNRTEYSGTAKVSYTVNGATKSRTMNITRGSNTSRLTTLSIGSNKVILKDVEYTINGKSISASYNKQYSFTVSGPVTDPEV